ncbi:uncharacterized protein LOC105211890 [Zeugodacus cucurbitae]|uniref:UDP-GlcNAc:betaGal beta-1,3-N-acetylglucosaminyltransferase 5A n=1 Tax=Zeugodacus cucurbitae TaxID=28588 RepID=A0A0A1X757_ZEUCU|nr:uncharacterized protein LOC105211890 [Zeugodacus cucurbitae]
MLERRPLWGLIVLLNVCVVIWRMQEPAMLSVEYDGSGAGQNIDLEDYALPLHQQRQQQHQPQVEQHPVWRRGLAVRNAIAQQQLYAGKHLLADSAEANEIAAKVTRKADDSLHISGHSSSSRSSSSRFSTSHQQLIKGQTTSLRSVSSVKSTPSPLVTAATLKNTAEVQTTTTGNAREYSFPADDFEKLIDLHDFTYLISQEACGRDVQALILVHSAPANEEKRRLIRETWGNTEQLPPVNGVMPLRIIFLVGNVDSEALQLDIERENFENGDIVQGSFVDSYRNMTYKHVMAFKWFLYNCAQAQILIKVDDDVYVNTPQLLIYLERATVSGDLENVAAAAAADVQASAAISLQHTADNDRKAFENNTIVDTSSSGSGSSSSTSSSSSVRNAADANAAHSQTNATQFNAAQMIFQHPRDLLLCKTTINAMVKRSYRSKWRVTAREFPGRYYPPYCPGYAIIYSPDVVLALYNAAQVSTYFWIDDVHITGVLAQNLSIAITNADQYILYEPDCDNLLNDIMTSDDVEFLYAWHLINPQQVQQLWEMYLAKAQRHFAAAATSTFALLQAAAAKQQTSPHPTDYTKFKSYR